MPNPTLASQDQTVQQRCAAEAKRRGWSVERTWQKIIEVSELLNIPLLEGLSFMEEALLKAKPS